MSNKDDAPKGELAVHFTARLPDHSQQKYNWLHHPLPIQQVHAFSTSDITQADARVLVEKIRAANTGLDVTAKWTGDLGL